MRSRPSRRAGKRATRRNLVSGGLVGVVFAISLTLVPVASNSNLKGGGKPVVAKPMRDPRTARRGKAVHRLLQGDTERHGHALPAWKDER